MKQTFKLTIFSLLLCISCTKNDNENSTNTKSGTRITSIVNNPSNPTFKLEFKYNQNKLTEVVRPLNGTFRRIEYQNELATTIKNYVNNELVGTTELIYENNKLIKTDNGQNSNNFLVFSYSQNLLSRVEQFSITSTGALISDFTMDYLYEAGNVTKRTLSTSEGNIEYEYTYDNKKHHYSTIPEPIRVYFFWSEGINLNNYLTQKIYIDDMFNSESSLEYMYNDFDLPTSLKNIDGGGITEFTYE